MDVVVPWVRCRERREAHVVAETLEQVYGGHRQGLFTLALSITRCAARAEDAVQEAFVRMCRNASQGRKGDLVAYAYAAVRNAAIDQRRRVKAQQPKLESIFNGRHDAAAEREALEAERETVIAAAIEDLPEEQREAIVLRVYAQLTFVQIAEVVDAPLQTVATRYRRALERLRERLGRLV